MEAIAQSHESGARIFASMAEGAMSAANAVAGVIIEESA